MHRACLPIVALLALVFMCVAAPDPTPSPEQLRKDFPPTFNWPDRRPIGTLFLAASGKNWPGNPRGYFYDEKLDIRTEQGRADLRTRMLKVADDAIAYTREVGGQGVIVWDLEGGEFPHATTYIGDPRVLPKVAPEMDAIADEFFRKFKDANMPVGICIRPSKIVFKDPNDPTKWAHIKTAYGHTHMVDPVEEIVSKIDYARKRWGCTIYYMDTNVTLERDAAGNMLRDAQDKPKLRLLTAAEMRDIHRKHPDVLIWPEFQTPGYFASNSGYGEFHTLGDLEVKERAIYPDAFRVWATRMQEDDIYRDWDKFLAAGIKPRDVFLFQIMPAKNGMGPLLQRAYEDAASNEAPPRELEALITTARDHKSWALRRRAITALADHKEPSATAALAAIVEKNTDALELFAARALAKQNTDEAFKVLLAMLEKPGRPAFAAAFGLGATGRAEAVAPIIRAFEATKEFQTRWAIIDALGELKKPEAVPMLVANLRALAKGSAVVSRVKTIRALGAIGDRAAIAPLLEALADKAFEPQRPLIARALRQITGIASESQSEAYWRKAVSTQPNR